MPGSSFYKRLRQRKIFQWAVGYLAGAWLLMQLIDVLGGRWGLTDALGRAIDVALAFGFFIVLIVAWFHGDRGHQRVKPVELLLIALVVTAGVAVFSYFRLSDPVMVEEFVQGPDSARENHPSLAIMPLTNASAGNGEEAAIFAAGIHEDLINTLSQIESIKVISRTSVMGFEPENQNAGEIARALGVRNLLEGGVQLAGDQVRISLRLVDAESDSHLWSRTYREALTTQNIFSIQADVARKVAAALETVLTTDEEGRIDRVGTDNLEAYRLYLKGREYWHRRTPDSIAAAISLFEEAIAADETFAAAYVGLANVYQHLGLAIYSVMPTEDALPLAQDALLRALELDNQLADTYAALGMLRHWYSRDWVGAEQAFEKAIELNPNQAMAYQWYSHFKMARGDLDGAAQQIKIAQSLNPRSLITYVIASLIFDAGGRTDAAIAEAEVALEHNPHYWSAHTMLAFAHGGQQQFDKARMAAEMAVSDSRRSVYALATLGWVCGRSGDTVCARDVLAELESRGESGYVSPYNLALVYIGLDQKNQALNYLRDSVPDLFLMYVRQWHIFDPLRGEPEFDEIVREIGF